MCVALFGSTETNVEALKLSWWAEYDEHPLSQDCVMTGDSLRLICYCNLQSYETQDSFWSPKESLNLIITLVLCFWNWLPNHAEDELGKYIIPLFWIKVNILKLRGMSLKEPPPFPSIFVYTVVFSSNCVCRQSTEVHAGVINVHSALIKPT